MLIGASIVKTGRIPSTRTCDCNLDTAWSNWKEESSQTDHNPWLSYTFDKAYKLNGLELYHTGEAVPSAFDVWYLDADGITWQDGHIQPDHVTTAAKKATRVDLSSLPPTKGIKLALTYYDRGYYAKVAEVKIFEAKPTVTPSSDDYLADLRSGGTTFQAFNQTKNDYQLELAGDVTAYPLVQAVAEGTAASVTIDQPNASNQGKATVTVRSADVRSQRNYTIQFSSLATLSKIQVTPPTTTNYLAGQALDTAGMTVTAIFTRDGETSARTTCPSMISNCASADSTPRVLEESSFQCFTKASQTPSV